MDEDWTVVKSKKDTKEEKKIHEEITNKIKETEILGQYKMFEPGDSKCNINTEILLDPVFLEYITYRFKINFETTNNNRLTNIDNNLNNSLITYFKKLPINLENYSKIYYSSVVESRMIIKGKILDIKNIYKVSLKNKRTHQIILIFTTSEKGLPYGVIKYIDNKFNTTDVEFYLFANYYLLMLFLYSAELRLGLRKSTLLERYPSNFDDLSKTQLSTHIYNYNRIWVQN